VPKAGVEVRAADARALALLIATLRSLRMLVDDAANLLYFLQSPSVT